MTSTEKSRTTIALITGAGREGGLGHEVARQLAAKGHHVILTARSLAQVGPSPTRSTPRALALPHWNWI